MSDERPDYDSASLEMSSPAASERAGTHGGKRPEAGEPGGLEIAQAEQHVRDVVEDRLEDPNLDTHVVDKAEEALESGDVKQEITLGHLIEEDSPYMEVRAAVSNVDDVAMPVNTFRAWFLGLITTVVVPGVNQLLALRFPSTTITGYVVIVLAYPLGQALAWILPRWTWKTRFGNFTLNPGPFNVKEHALISIMGLMSYQSAYAAGILAVQRMSYGQSPSFGYGVLLILSTQLLGLSFATLMRRILVWPAMMIWPSNLPKATLLNSLHGLGTIEGSEERRGWSRVKFFWVVFALLFCYQFLPGYLFSLLSAGNWFCLIAPNNVPLNQVLGTQSGISLLPFTFDWNVISVYVSPLATPWWSQVNLLGGFILFFVVVTPAMYYTNVWNAKHLPMFSSTTFDRFGEKYDVSRVVDYVDGMPVFNADKYNEYSLQYLPTALTVSYFLSFASVIAVLVHVGLFYGPTIWRQLRASPSDTADVHMRLMAKYKETPFYWYAALFLASFGMGLGALYGWATGLPWWAFVIAILIGVVFLVPTGVVTAMTNQEVGLNMISELIVGYMLPGRPIAMMIFKTTMYMVTAQAVQFVQDQKLAHYMKLPPRTVFVAQVFATAVGGVAQLAVQTWAFSNIPGICEKDQPQKFNCAPYTVFGTASIVWGLIGPMRMFSRGRSYNALMYGFLVGALVPIPLWLLARRFPRAGFHMINFPVIFTGTGNIPPGTGVNFLAPIEIGFISQFVWRRYRPRLWAKFNYILSAALDGASAIATVVIFFALQFPSGGSSQFYESGWWGNVAWTKTADANALPYLATPPSGFAGTPIQVGQPA
ncbi:hypothetical protein MSPP1_004239 [Malassezia sp. CBS 17886]|nr:hypothetical protein MSPP1_004239 [Malassezia sp. CBS 17886]